MSDRYYTHAMWKVKPGNETEFQRIWREELADAFRSLNPHATGTLIQSVNDSRLFFSFGPWDSIAEIERARADARASAAMAKLRALCEEATPGAYRVVLTVP